DRRHARHAAARGADRAGRQRQPGGGAAGQGRRPRRAAAAPDAL
ncbi:MAG: hypothetical protein AVDCRST_MAG27-4633, partial [uncultured Craurococcus sp.]